MVFDPFGRLEDDPEDGGEEPAKEKEKDSGRLSSKLMKARSILVSEPISSHLAQKIYQQLLLLELDDPDKAITVFVNSPGGEADSGFGIYDMLRFVRPPIRTIVCGLCASAAVMVFLAGEKGQRLTLPNSRFLLHQPSSASMGQASDLEIASREILKLRERYNEIVALETGKKREQVDDDADRDFWMTASEAVDYGLANRVVTTRQELG